MEKVAITIGGEEKGSLRISRDGLYTVLEAEAPGCAGLVRLWAHGGGKSTYLGVMQPWSGGLWLRRRLSRRELADFPEPIEAVSDQENENGTHNRVDITQETEEKTEHEAGENEEEQADAKQEESLHNEGTDARACPWPAEPPEEGLLWYRRPDGSLVSFDGISSLVAIPSALRGAGPRGAERLIEGKKYLVFRY